MLAEGTYGKVYKVKCGESILALKEQETNESALIGLAILMTYSNENIIAVRNFDVRSHEIQLYMEFGKSMDRVVMFSSNREDYWFDVYMNENIHESLHIGYLQRSCLLALRRYSTS